MGKFSFLEVLDAQRTLFDAMAQSQQSLAQSHRYAAELQGILGQTPANTQ